MQTLQYLKICTQSIGLDRQIGIKIISWCKNNMDLIHLTFNSEKCQPTEIIGMRRLNRNLLVLSRVFEKTYLRKSIKSEHDSKYIKGNNTL